MRTAELGWDLLIIGGAQLTGKSTLATQLGERLGVHVLEADLFSMVANRALPRAKNPGIRFFGGKDVWQLSTDDLAERLVRFAQVMCDQYEVVVAHHLLKRSPTILEGPSLLPSFAVQNSYAMGRTTRPRALPSPGQIRSLFLYEEDEVEVTRRMQERDGTNERLGRSTEQDAKVLHRYGQIVRAQAEDLGLPTLPSRPFSTLLNRALAILAPPSA